jgi:hypothetical protein
MPSSWAFLVPPAWAFWAFPVGFGIGLIPLVWGRFLRSKMSAFSERITRDAEMSSHSGRLAALEVELEQERVAALEVETTWGVDCSQWVHHPWDDERIPWIEYTRNQKGEIKLTGTRTISRVAPVEDPRLLGDHSDCSEWLRDHAEHLKQAIALRHPPTIWERIEAE